MSTSRLASQEILGLAEVIADDPPRGLGGVWPRVSAILARQALEAALGELWSRSGVGGLAQISMKAQLICLGTYVDDSVAEDAAYLWSALSQACHHHPYDLSPTAGEMKALLVQSKELLAELAN